MVVCHAMLTVVNKPFMLRVILLNVIMLSVIMLNVVAPAVALQRKAKVINT
jgi:hypothetical protein